MVAKENAGGRVDTLEIKARISKKLGPQRADKYFHIFTGLISGRISKPEFDRLCCSTVGRENLPLHNLFIKAIFRNACLGHSPPCRQTATGHSRSTRTSRGKLGDTVVPKSPVTGRVGEHPLEITNSCEVPRLKELRGAPELISAGSKGFLEVLSVEEGEEVEQMKCSPSIQSRSPVRIPYGVTLNLGHGCSVGSFLPSLGESRGDCSYSGELPDTLSLRDRLECRLKSAGLTASIDCINMLNNGLDLYLKRLIKPCVELTRACRGNNLVNNRPYVVSMQDFETSMLLSPQLLGVNWPTKLEKICLREAE